MRPGAISRRRFVAGAGAVGVSATGLGLLAGCGRLPGQAQVPSPARLRRIGYLDNTIAADAADRIYHLRQGLSELGYLEGENIILEIRTSDGRPERLPELVAGLLQLEPDVLVTFADLPIDAARRATTTVPIVMIGSRDPVGAGFVPSLGRPAGNVTGLSQMMAQLSGKRLELLRDAVPAVSRVAVLWNPGVAELARSVDETRVAAQRLGIQLISLEVQDASDLAGAFEAAVSEHAEALITLLDYFTGSYRTQITAFAAGSRLPAMYTSRIFTVDGGLMSYGPSVSHMYRRAAYYIDRILKGAKPADLPVEQPMTFEFVVNLKTAQALGITFPNEIMLQVTEVVQ